MNHRRRKSRMTGREPIFVHHRKLQNKLVRETELFLTHMLVYDDEFKVRRPTYFEKVTSSFFESLSRWGLTKPRSRPAKK